MSVSLMSVAFRAPLPTTQKFVLVALCDTANDQGECYPSITTLMERCSLSERAVQSSIRSLEQLGYLRREFRSGRSTVYWISPEIPQSPERSHYVYRIDYEGGAFYIGVRTCAGRPENDAYAGSGAGLRGMVMVSKRILSRHADRASADDAERREVEAVLMDPRCLNRKVPAGANPRTTCTPHDVPPAPGAPTPAPPAPPPPHHVHPTPAPGAPITIKEPSVEPSRNRQRRAPVVTVEVADLVAEGFDAQTAADFIAHKTGRKAPLTPRAWADHLREAAKAGWTPQQAAEKTMARNWSGFESSYVVGGRPPAPAGKPARAGINQAERAAALQRALGYRDEDVIDA